MNVIQFWLSLVNLDSINFDNFFLRGYVVADKAGNSYDMVFTGININRAWKSDEQWFQEYIGTYAGIELSGNPLGLTDQQKHDQARAVADTGRYLPGTPEFDAAFNKSINGELRSTTWSREREKKELDSIG